MVVDTIKQGSFLSSIKTSSQITWGPRALTILGSSPNSICPTIITTMVSCLPPPTTWDQCVPPQSDTFWEAILRGRSGALSDINLILFLNPTISYGGFTLLIKKRFIKHISACAELLRDNAIASCVTSSCAHPHMTWYIMTVSKLSPFNNGMYGSFRINSPTSTSNGKTL